MSRLKKVANFTMPLSKALDTMKIREFKAKDQPGINKLQEEFMIEFFPEFADDPKQYEWNADIYDVNEHYLNRGGRIWVADIGNYVAGFGGFRLVDRGTAEIKRVRVNSQHRGQGLEKSIVKEIENYCSGKDIRKILVDTDDRFEIA
jgi:GNAT superfamily N-acetyltransferase